MSLITIICIVLTIMNPQPIPVREQSSHNYGSPMLIHIWKTNHSFYLNFKKFVLFEKKTTKTKQTTLTYIIQL